MRNRTRRNDAIRRISMKIFQFTSEDRDLAGSLERVPLGVNRCERPHPAG
jgi:hypothetical protein